MLLFQTGKQAWVSVVKHLWVLSMVRKHLQLQLILLSLQIQPDGMLFCVACDGSVLGASLVYVIFYHRPEENC